jgi:hypothetical protein
VIFLAGADYQTAMTQTTGKRKVPACFADSWGTKNHTAWLERLSTAQKSDFAISLSSV